MATPANANTNRPASRFHTRSSAAQHLGISVLAFDKLAETHQVSPRVYMGSMAYYTQAQVDRVAGWMAEGERK